MATELDRVLYTANATVTGGRTGHGATDDGLLEVDLRAPVALGGPGGGTNPEQLFAVGYAACFLSALGGVARSAKVDVSQASIVAQVDLGRAGEHYGLAVVLTVTLPGLDSETARSLAEKAHEGCPYSRATRGNIPVEIVVAEPA